VAKAQMNQPSHSVDRPVRPVIEPGADARFRDFVRGAGLDPDNRWVGGYVDYEWEHGRHIYQTAEPALPGKVYLEYGCNYGATSVVLAALGVQVVGVDVDMTALRIARLNAERYGLVSRTTFLRCSNRPQLPFLPETFDGIVCNSVLEYVPARTLRAIQQELDRVLKPHGLIFVTGTSNRLAPREIHSGRWFTNYLPQRITELLGIDGTEPRGVSPVQVRQGFGSYDNLDWQDAGRAYLEARARMSPRRRDRMLRRLAHRLARLCGVSLGLLTPSLSVTLRKRGRDCGPLGLRNPAKR
jgi:SAM-dependent methyltransferase